MTHLIGKHGAVMIDGKVPVCVECGKEVKRTMTKQKKNEWARELSGLTGYSEKFIPNLYKRGLAEIECVHFIQELKEFIQSQKDQSYLEGKEEERTAWLEHKRCHSCGESMKPKPLSDICDKCFEEA